MLMAINEWDSSTIQAYRLYKLGVFMNCEAMSESFQMLADRLRDAKRSIERSIKKTLRGMPAKNWNCQTSKLKFRLP